jgi:hypothetical protein
MAFGCIKEQGMMDVWGDSLGAVYFDGNLHSVGQAQEASTPAALHYIWDVDGNRVAKITAPFTAEAEMICSKAVSGKLTAIGGTNASEIWQFDPAIAGNTAGSWTQIDSSFITEIGARAMSQGADANGWFYIFGGRDNSTVYKTQNFTSWTLVGSLPANLTRWCGGACCEHGGKIYLIGGATNLGSPYGNTEMLAAEVLGYVYRFDPADDSFTLVTTDQVKFGQVWCDAGSDGTKIWLCQGYVSATQAATYGVPPRVGNQRGLWYSSDNGANWSSQSLIDGPATLFERHRTGIASTGSVAYLYCGNFANDLWRLT